MKDEKKVTTMTTEDGNEVVIEKKEHPVLNWMKENWVTLAVGALCAIGGGAVAKMIWGENDDEDYYPEDQDSTDENGDDPEVEVVEF